MTIKKWVSIGIVYVCAVVIAYSVLTGENPFESTNLEPHDHAAERVLEVDKSNVK